MQYTALPARPAAGSSTLKRLRRRLSGMRRVWRMTGGVAMMVAGIVWMGPAIHLPGGASATHAQRAGTPRSWLQNSTLLTVYGRGFDTAPILGQLGEARSLDDVARRTAVTRAAIERLTGHGKVRMAIHLIYGLAVPCTGISDRCVLYLDETGVDIVHRYIEPAARRGWLVILDDQLGRSTPAAEMRRIAARGYLAYDNVEVAFDPEFRTMADQQVPGRPPGWVSAEELNDAERVMAAESRRASLRHQKVMLVHQWTPNMIVHRPELHTREKYVQVAIVMDGIGPADEKAGAYTSLMPPSLPRDGILPGIKLFFANPFDPSTPDDRPLLTWPQLLNGSPIHADNGQSLAILPVPRVIVLT